MLYAYEVTIPAKFAPRKLGAPAPQDKTFLVMASGRTEAIMLACGQFRQEFSVPASHTIMHSEVRDVPVVAVNNSLRNLTINA